LDKQERIESIISRLQAEGGTEEQLTEVAEMLTPFEKETVGKVHRQLGKLSSSRMQVAETLFILKTHLHYRQAS